VLEGWDREFPTLRELLDVLKGCTLKSGDESFTVKRCCPPKPGGTRTGDLPSATLEEPQRPGVPKGLARVCSLLPQRSRTC